MVHLAHDELLDRRVAIKRIGLLPGTTDDDVLRAEREARLAAGISHSHVVSIFDLVRDDDCYWLVMEHVPSRSLAAITPDDVRAWHAARVLEAPVVLVSLVPRGTWTTQALPPVYSIESYTALASRPELLRPIVNSLRAASVATVANINFPSRTGLDASALEVEQVEVERTRAVADPDERARAGVFLAFQYPVEIPGVSNTYFLKAALNAIREHRGEPELDAVEFLKLVREKMKLVQMDETLLNRPVNEGFSGGEKKRNEIFHMSVLEPKLAILDETDSGLDIDALKIVAGGVNSLRSPDRSFLLITHYQRLLDYIVPDFVHVMVDGRIVRSGGKELALELEEQGYASFEADLQRETAGQPATA